MILSEIYLKIISMMSTMMTKLPSTQ